MNQEETKVLEAFQQFWRFFEIHHEGEYEWGQSRTLIEAVGGGNATINDDMMRSHLALFGETGHGKSRLMLHLISQHLANNHSVVAFVPDKNSVLDLISACIRRNLQPAQLTFISLDDLFDELPLPGWNPLDWKHRGVSLKTAVDRFTTTLEGALKEPGRPFSLQMAEYIRHAATLAAAHDLSFIEVHAILSEGGYAEGLLNRPLRSTFDTYQTNRPTYETTVKFLRNSFLKTHFDPKSSRSSDVDATLRRIRTLVENTRLAGVLAPPRSSINFQRFWGQQRVFIVHLPPSLKALDNRLLAGFILDEFLAVGERLSLEEQEQPRNVIVSIDEVKALEGVVGEQLKTYIGRSRKANLRIMAATQAAYELEVDLAEKLRGRPTRVYFHLSDKDATALAKTISLPKAQEPPAIERFIITPGSKSQGTKRIYYVLDCDGDAVRPAAHDVTLLINSQSVEPSRVAEALSHFIGYLSDDGKFYIDDLRLDNSMIPLWFLQKLEWDMRLVPGEQLRIQVTIPSFNVKPVQRKRAEASDMASALMDLKKQEILLKTSERTGFVKVDPVQDRLPNTATNEYLARSQAAVGIPFWETIETQEAREKAIAERIASVRLPPKSSEASYAAPKALPKMPPRLTGGQEQRVRPRPAWMEDEE